MDGAGQQNVPANLHCRAAHLFSHPHRLICCPLTGSTPFPASLDLLQTEHGQVESHLAATASPDPQVPPEALVQGCLPACRSSSPPWLAPLIWGQWACLRQRQARSNSYLPTQSLPGLSTPLEEPMVAAAATQTAESKAPKWRGTKCSRAWRETRSVPGSDPKATWQVTVWAGSTVNTCLPLAVFRAKCGGRGF